MQNTSGDRSAGGVTPKVVNYYVLVYHQIRDALGI